MSGDKRNLTGYSWKKVEMRGMLKQTPKKTSSSPLCSQSSAFVFDIGGLVS